MYIKHTRKCFIGLYFVDTDVDECSDPGICPANAVCVNSKGSFYCECSEGYTKNNNAVCQGKS